ncbi:hypothetical protein [Actinopolymorpha pittospori]|uniref:Uncharacterized protein n=1 Tax=Actinopolymorpha pittospori TaxID=648752 RepID=A0A927REV7_9ACTN|nr:hypothetical protein [Actinopolymorpha pittospori]MBE1612634.1 hypothetical protein [Actinopolymorpha pittospori]
MPEQTCPLALGKAIETAGGRDNLTERELQLLDLGVRAGLQRAHDVIAQRLRERPFTVAE